jgi:hypothetical protein
MASRPLFIAQTDGPAFVRTLPVTFGWHAGVAESQRKKNLAELHAAASAAHPDLRLMEVSRFAQTEAGVALSAFNLTFVTRGRGREISVECAFQGSKVFAAGGPFTDLFEVSSLQAKRDPRLLASGPLIGFRFFGSDWPIEPQTAFYDWLYLNALRKRPELTRVVIEKDAFTDIAFNPEKSINCQAGAVALYVALTRRGVLEQTLETPETYLAALRKVAVSNARQDDLTQGRLSLG